MKTAFIAITLLAVVLTGCSSEAPKPAKKEAKKAAEPVTARYAFHQTFIMARTWAQDLELLRVRNLVMEGSKVEPGKAEVWEVTFVSPSKRKSRAYTFSVVEKGNIHEGPFAGMEGDWSGRDGQATSFLTAAFRKDSTEAWLVAAEKSKEYMAKYPDKPITFLLEKTPRHPDPSWRVIWAASVSTADYSIFVDASTGEFLERMR